MTEALSLEPCDAIAVEIMENPEKALRKEGEQTKSKIVMIQLNFFTKEKAAEFCGCRCNLGYGSNKSKMSVEDQVAFLKSYVSNSIKEKNMADRMESLVTILVDGNEVFREAKTFDLLEMSIQAG
ncbi:MAG: hypothetical protein KDK63_03715 [Chlamydiia bacterium]|nr:hypothetical protein [Chlamydiia bacterium]